MSSLSARRSSQPRRPPTPSSTSSSNPSPPLRSQSDDSQTIFVNSSEQEEQEQEDQEQEPQYEREQKQAQTTTRPPTVDDVDSDVKKCWICFSDSTEDTPETSPWRDPCPCALVAHEECLLDWVADTEAPKSSRNQGITGPKIECPQCKSEIKLARPRDYIVDAVRSCERVGTSFVTPAALTIVSGSLYTLSMYWGAHSIYAVFGADDGFRILRPLIANATRPPIEVYAGSPRTATSQLLGVIVDHLVHWRLYVGLPLLGPILILSRTTFADAIFPALPIVFFASQTHGRNEAIDFTQWSPSASFAFAVLPYVRGLYNMYYNKVWAAKERQWLAEIQPRATQGQVDAAAGDANANQGQEPRDDENVFEVRIDRGIWDDWGQDQQVMEDVAADQAEQQRHHHHHHHDHDEDEAAPMPEVQNNRPLPQGNGNEQAAAPQQPQRAAADAQAQRQANQQAGLERRLSFSPHAIAQTCLGAIIFPTLAGLTGEALKLILPTSWTTPLPSPRSLFSVKLETRAFLQHKWARSLIGGCLLVVFKDALMLYARWKMARMHRSRRIVDFDRRKGSSKRAT